MITSKIPALPHQVLFARIIVCAAAVLIGSVLPVAVDADILDEYDEVKPATVQEAPQADPQQTRKYTPEQVARGRYMVQLVGCGSCHTDGALVGKPDTSRYLAGSRVGIAYSNPMAVKYPGVLYPANLTPDEKTGLGSWTDEEIIQAIRTGIDRHGRQMLSVMPWSSYNKLSVEDATAIVSYLRGLKPVQHEVPDKVLPGTKAVYPYVHFGVYQSKQPD